MSRRDRPGFASIRGRSSRKKRSVAGASGSLLRMGRSARWEIVQAKAAFAARDVEMAEDLVRKDRETNLLNREIFQLAIDIGTDADTREWAMHMVMVARAIERIGDNAVDIGEQTAFVVRGLFREFSDSSHPQPS